MSIFCRHDWEIKHRETTLSAVQQLAAAGARNISPMEGIDPFAVTSITILACKKCGLINKTVVRCGS